MTFYEEHTLCIVAAIVATEAFIWTALPVVGLLAVLLTIGFAIIVVIDSAYDRAEAGEHE